MTGFDRETPAPQDKSGLAWPHAEGMFGVGRAEGTFGEGLKCERKLLHITGTTRAALIITPGGPEAGGIVIGGH